MRTQHLAQVVRGLDVTVGEGLGGIEAGHHADLAAVVAESLVQQFAHIVLDHRGFDRAVEQHLAALLPSRLDAGRRDDAGPLGRCGGHQAGLPRVQRQDAGDELRGLGGAVTAADADDGDAAAGVVREQVADDRLTDVLWLTLGRLDVHQQARASVDLDDGAAGLGEGSPDVGRDDIDASDVEADDARRQTGLRGHLGVDLGGAVDGDVAVALDHHRGAGGGNRIAVSVALASDLQMCSRIEPDLVERLILAAAAPRVAVELGFDELANGRLAVTDHRCDVAARGRHHSATDD